MFHKSSGFVLACLPWLIVLVVGGWLLATPLADPDLWWHLAAGRDLWAGHFPWLDRLCGDTAGREWIDLHWGFQAILWGCWKLFGPMGGVLLRAAGLLAAFVIAAARRRLSLSGALLVVAALWIVREAVDMRPLVLTLALLALQWRMLERWCRQPSRGRAAVVVLAQVALCNVQGLHALGPLCALAFLSQPLQRGATRRAGVLLLGTLVLATFLTPWPLEGARLPWRLLERVLPGFQGSWGQVSENMPLWAFRVERPLLVWGTLWALLLAVASGEARGYRWRMVLWGTGMAFLALGSVRNVPLLLLFCVFVLARSLPFWKHRLRIRAGRWVRSRWLAWSCGTLLLLVPLGMRWQEGRWEMPGRFVAPLAFPEAVPELGKIAAGSLYHPLEWGGWISYHIAPELCGGDTRLVLRGRAALDSHLARLEEPVRWDAWARRQGIDAALLPLWNSPKYRSLLEHLLSGDEWRLVNLDGASALLVRGDWTDPVKLDPPDWLRKGRGAPFLLRASALMETARVLARTNHPELASRWAQEVLR